MDCWAIIPAKAFALGKSRLASVLGAKQRTALNRRLFGRVLDATLGIFPPNRTIVVTADPLLLALMRGQGVEAVDDPGAGLNGALGLACRYAVERGARAVAVLPCDLPEITVQDVKALTAALAAMPSCVIAPDAQEEGTNALALAPASDDFFRFGPESFRAHLKTAQRRHMAVHILRRPGLARDLDTPADYRSYAKQQLASSGVPA